jgi:hypothetical protein
LKNNHRVVILVSHALKSSFILKSAGSQHD